MTATAATPVHRRGRQSSTLTRVCRRSAVVLGFGALTWAAFTGAAMALDSQDGATPSPTVESSAPGPGISLDTLGDVTKPLTEHLTQPLIKNVTEPVTQSVTGSVTDKLASTGTAADRTLNGHPAAPTPGAGRQTGAPQSNAPTGGRGQRDPLTTATTVVGDHLVSTLHTLSHPTSIQPTQPTQPTDQATATQPTGSMPSAAEAPDTAQTSPQAAAPDTNAAPVGTTQLSLTSLTRGIEDAASDLTGSMLTTTHLDQAVSTPQLHVLSDTLDGLGVDSALPVVTIPTLSLVTEPLRSLPVVGDSVGDVISALPVATSDLPVPGGQTGSGTGSHTQTQTGPGTTGAPVPSESIEPASPAQPVAVGAVPTLPALLPVESTATGAAADDQPSALTRPAEPSLLAGTPTAYSSSADDQQGVDMDELAAVLASLGQTASDGSLPLPAPTPQGPDGHQGGGTTGAGHQDRGDVATFRLPDALTTSPVRTGRWVLQTAPPSDPGFSPD